MIETLIAMFIATICAQGENIPDWTLRAQTLNRGNITASVRLYTPEMGVRWLWVFDDQVLFLTRSDTGHGYCAREYDG